MSNEDYKQQQRSQGRFITAIDLAERLLPDLKMNELLMWAPDLFAFTSYILSLTGAYQVVVSPPRDKRWFPKNSEIKLWLGIDNDYQQMRKNLTFWLENAKTEWGVKIDTENEIESLILRVVETLEFKPKTGDGKEGQEQLRTLLENDDRDIWIEFVQKVGDNWNAMLAKITEHDFSLINDGELTGDNPLFSETIYTGKRKSFEDTKKRNEELLKILLKYTPGVLIACWAYFYNEVNNPHFYQPDKVKFMRTSDLLCNQDGLQQNEDLKNRLWYITQALITMHAIADIACTGWGIKEKDKDGKTNKAKELAEKLLFRKGSLSTINPERGRVMPKRHNPGLGITLRSISSNLGFHRSSVEVVWRRASENNLVKKLRDAKDNEHSTISILLLPFPLSIKTKDFKAVERGALPMSGNYGFFAYEPLYNSNENIEDILKVIEKANEELAGNEREDSSCVDILVFPESSLGEEEVGILESKLANLTNSSSPSIYIAGVREGSVNSSKSKANFSRNVVYCKYFDKKTKYGNFDSESSETPKYKQYKHHRWQLNNSQIRQYGLSRVLYPEKLWWESAKVSKRRVSFLNVGDKITVSHLICEDLARQDPISDLIRHVGPSLVVTILMDGPQLRDRWSSRYATVLSDDPGSSVITLTSFGLVKRWTTPYKEMSRVVALWSEGGNTMPRELELAQGAKGILLTLSVELRNEKTADGRQERYGTNSLKLVDVIQIYPDKDKPA
ncbi:MAG TPA: hypothetical protein VF571_06200 [Pyrinomonadaceae bacterium]|jgi:hypothetical protein